ncbi:MAG TPA: acetylornithine deacetylase [Gemmatimonadales bacterium]
MTREELLRRLIAIDSRSEVSNRGIADFICDYVEEPGVRIARNQSPDGTKLNVVATRGPARDDRSGLVLSGHMDTVPFGEPDWATDPLVLGLHDHRYFGRGVCDMKGFLALAVERFAEAPAALAHPLVLLLTYDEELGTIGARHLVETWSSAERLPQAAVIGEPTSLEVVRMHKGHFKLRIVMLGRPGHSAYPASGRNAIEMAGDVIRELRRLGRELEGETPPEAALFGEIRHATINLATIAGGTALNVIPGRCVLEIGIRLLPGMTGGDMAERVRRAVERAVGREAYFLEPINESPAMATPEAAPIHGTLCALAGQAGSRAVAFTTDGGWLGKLGLDCVVFGPGSIQAAHRPNEWLPVAEFERAAGLLESVVERSCIRPG